MMFLSNRTISLIYRFARMQGGPMNEPLRRLPERPAIYMIPLKLTMQAIKVELEEENQNPTAFP
jgi:hypothetical protein